MPAADVLPSLDPLSELGDVRTALNLVALAEVLQREHLLMLVTQVSEPEADTGAVLGRGPDHLAEDLGDVQSLQLLAALVALPLVGWQRMCRRCLGSEGNLLLVVGL